jgi:hypothetical protein
MLRVLLNLLWGLNSYVEALSSSHIPKTGTPPNQRELSGLAYDSSSNKIYIYGGRLESFFDDMWEFDLTSKSWTEIHSPGMNPGARSRPFMTMLENSREILLFGGDTKNGPISDVWVYDLSSETVNFIQWKLVDIKGKAPPRAYNRAVCDYFHDGKHYIAVYGGRGRFGYLNNLHV